MAGNDTNQDGDGDSVDLVGTPVEPSRRMRGVSQEEYLQRGAGDTTEREMQLAGLIRHRHRRRLLIACLTLGCFLAALLLWWLA